MDREARAKPAAARLARDSSASESMLTEPVRRHATSLRRKVKMAAPMESQAYRVREVGGQVDGTVTMACRWRALASSPGVPFAARGTGKSGLHPGTGK